MQPCWQSIAFLPPPFSAPAKLRFRTKQPGPWRKRRQQELRARKTCRQLGASSGSESRTGGTIRYTRFKNQAGSSAHPFWYRPFSGDPARRDLSKVKLPKHSINSAIRSFAAGLLLGAALLSCGGLAAQSAPGNAVRAAIGAYGIELSGQRDQRRGIGARPSIFRSTTPSSVACRRTWASY